MGTHPPRCPPALLRAPAQVMLLGHLPTAAAPWHLPLKKWAAGAQQSPNQCFSLAALSPPVLSPRQSCGFTPSSHRLIRRITEGISAARAGAQPLNSPPRTGPGTAPGDSERRPARSCPGAQELPRSPGPRGPGHPSSRQSVTRGPQHRTATLEGRDRERHLRAPPAPRRLPGAPRCTCRTHMAVPPPRLFPKVLWGKKI